MDSLHDFVQNNLVLSFLKNLRQSPGGRGLDFQNIQLGVLAKPVNYLREANQKARRIGRGSEFGLVREIYCKQDFPDHLHHLQHAGDPQLAALIQAYADAGDNFEMKLHIMQYATALHNLCRCRAKSSTAAANDALQNNFFSRYHSASSKEHKLRLLQE